MKSTLSIIFILIAATCFGQEWVKKTVSSPEYENQQIKRYTALLNSTDDSTHYLHYDNRALEKYHLRDYYGALKDINLSIKNNSNYCHAYWLRATLKLKLNKRDESCEDWRVANNICSDKYQKEYTLYCDEKWNYSDTIKVHFSDSMYLNKSGYRKESIIKKGNSFVTCYDSSLTLKKELFKTINDTNFHISYYRNGQMKKLNKTLTEMGSWFFEAEWCENGQLKFERNPNSIETEFVREYLCDGTISMEYYKSKFGYRGLFKIYHKNGQVAEQGNFEKTANSFGDQKVGLWESFLPNGKKFYQANFENGLKVDEQSFE